MDPFTQRMLRRAKLWREKQLMPISLKFCNFLDRTKLIVTILSEEEQCSNYNIFKQAPTLSEDKDALNTRPQINMFSSCDTASSTCISTEADKSLSAYDALSPLAERNVEYMQSDIQRYKRPQHCKQILSSEEKGTQKGSKDSTPCHTAAGTAITPNSKLSSSSVKRILLNPLELSYIIESDYSVNDLEQNLMRKKHCNKGVGMQEERNSLSCYENGSEVLYDSSKEEQQFLNHVKHSDTEMIVNEIPVVCTSKSDINIRIGKEVLLAEEICEIEDNKDDIDEVPPLHMQGTSWQAHKDPVAEEQETHNQILSLHEEIQKQDVLRRQCSKAIAVCKSLKEFNSSLEHLEAERFLLLFSVKQEAAQQEICHMQNAPLETTSAVLGTIIIETISFPLSEHFLRNIQCGNHEHWFVCVGVHNTTVVATQASASIQEGRICFTDPLCFEKLPHSLSIKLMLYYMKLKRNKFSNKKKYHIPKEKKHQKFPFALRRSRSSLYLLGEEALETHNTVAFKLIATKTLRLSNIETAFYVDKVEIPNIIEGNMYLLLYVDVAMNIRHTGFLDIMKEHKDLPTWERYWCRLSGYNFSYWKYPSDEDIKKLEQKKGTWLFTGPEGNVDLRGSCSNKVKPAEKYLCPRPRTLLLITGREPLKQDYDTILTICKPQLTLIRHLWSASSLQELTQWCTHINKVLSILEEWRLLKSGTSNQEVQISTVL